MSQFTKHTGIIAPLNIANIDTDSIIPKQFLQETTRINFGKYLFFNWRFLDGQHKKINPHFILNQPCYQNSSILLSQRNFGCGSSREHAVWALIDYGFRVIIAPSFADIFYKNSFNNHLLLITLSELEINSLFINITTNQYENMYCTINLIKKTIFINKKQYSFKINEHYRYAMINKLDNIDLTLKNDSIIQEYENNQLSYLK